MSNTFSIVELWLWLSNYIFFGKIIPIFTMIVIGLYIRGYFVHKKIQNELLNSGFSITEKKINPSIRVFHGINKALDFLIGSTLNLAKAKIWQPLYGYVSSIITDSRIESTLNKLGADSSFKHRLEIAKREFSPKDNAYWWNRERAPDFREVSPIISGNWFNGKPVENYLSFLIHPKTFNACVRTGLIVAIASFLVLSVFYKPHWFLGYRANSQLHRMADETAKRIVADPSIIPEFRKDVWSAQEQAEIQSKASVVAQVYAKNILNNADGYSYHPWGIVFKNGIFTDLFLALAIGLFYIRRSYYNSYKALKIPFIKDSHELKGYENKKGNVNQYKMSLAAANTRATCFDRKSPLIPSFISTGLFEEKGVIGARRKNQLHYQSLSDMASNTLLVGAIGEGKTEKVLKQKIRHTLDLKNKYFANQKQYEAFFDTRVNRLTQKAIDAGYLKQYIPLPYNPIVVSMAIMDIKSQLGKDIYPIAESKYLGDEFLIIGADKDLGQLAIDLIADIDPPKARNMLSSVATQMGGEIKKDFWQGTGLKNVEIMMDIAYVFARTRAGMRFMRKYGIKVWSFMFISNLVAHDPENKLLAHAIFSIYDDATNCPERLSDILNNQRIQSIQYVLTKWQTMPQETKGGIEANMNFIMDGYNNEKLKPFLTGIGESMTTVSEMWKYIVSFDLDTDKYQTSGKLVLLMAKTLLFEEAVKRQIRYSRRIMEITGTYRQHYKECLILDSSVELLPIDAFENPQTIALLSTYHELCSDVMQELSEINVSKGMIEPNVVWEAGTFTTELKKIVSSFPSTPGLEDFSSEFSSTLLDMATKALEIASKIRENEPRLAKDLKGIAQIDPSIFDASESDTPEVKARKEEHLELYYIYQDAKTRIAREHMFFIFDEYQELITLDTSGGCYSDYNFLNLNRSTNSQMFVAVQSANAFILKIEKAATDNFINQMRTQIYLVTEDAGTREYVSKLAGNTDQFQNINSGNPLLDNRKDTGFMIYDNFNYLISKSIQENKELEADGYDYKKNSIFPYTYDVFSTAEPIEIATQDITFDKVFSNLFETKYEFYIPSMKRHFLDETGIPEYKRTGSDIQGKQSNAEPIQNAWKQSRQSMEDKYQSFLNDGYKKDVPLLSDSDYTLGGNVHAFITKQRAGMTIKDYVIVAEDSYFQD